MENVLVTTELIAVSLLAFMLALVIEPLLVMAVLVLARKAARHWPRPAPEQQVAELRTKGNGEFDKWWEHWISERNGNLVHELDAAQGRTQ